MLFITRCLHYSCRIYTKFRLQERVNNEDWMKRGTLCYKSITITTTYIQLLLPVIHLSCPQSAWKKFSSSPDFPQQTLPFAFSLPTWDGSTFLCQCLTESWLSFHTMCKICFILLKQQCNTSVQQDLSTYHQHYLLITC